MNTAPLSERISYERLANGADVYLLPTSAEDVVTCMMAFPGGIHTTYDTQTVADLLAELMPGSTKRHQRHYVLERFEALGARISITVDREHLLVTLASRSVHFLEALRLTFEVLTTPTFTAGEFREAVVHVATGLAHAKEDTKAQTTLALTRALYRKGSPHWSPTISQRTQELATVRSADVLRWHRETFSSIGALICVVGDITPRTLMAAMRTLGAVLPERAPNRTPSVRVDRVATPRDRDLVVSLRDKMNVDTYLAIPLALARDHEDFLPLKVAVDALGGSFTARLFHTLRTKLSLTYGSYASLAGFADGYPGYLLAYAIFPQDVFDKGRTALRRVVKEFISGGITSRELAARKEEIAGKHKVALSTTAGMCGAIFETVKSGKPVGYVDEYPALVGSVTRRAVNGAIERNVAYGLSVTAAAGSIDKKGSPLA